MKRPCCHQPQVIGNAITNGHFVQPPRHMSGITRLPNQLEDAYRLMDEYKKVDGVKLQMSASDIRSVQECFGSDLVLIRMDNEAGNVLVCSRCS